VRLAQTADGGLVAGECEEKLTAMAAVSSARAYASEKAGANAFSQRGDPALGGSEPRHILARFGALPPNVEQFIRGFPQRASIKSRRETFRPSEARSLNRSNRPSSPSARRRLGPRP
jgi:hypothetical protein